MKTQIKSTGVALFCFVTKPSSDRLFIQTSTVVFAQDWTAIKQTTSTHLQKEKEKTTESTRKLRLNMCWLIFFLSLHFRKS